MPLTHNQSKKCALILDDATCIYHHEIWHVYNSNYELSEPHHYVRDIPVTLGRSIFHVRDDRFSVHQIEYPLGGSCKKSRHVYFLLIVAMVLLL